MSLEVDALKLATGALTVSGILAQERRAEEKQRRAGLKGTKLAHTPDGSIEYHFSPAKNRATDEAKTIVLENGLGWPLECWQWVVRGLSSQDVNVLRYHRWGYGRTSLRQRPAKLLEELIAQLGLNTAELVLCGHSIGTLVASNILSESQTISDRVKTFIFVDGTDGHSLARERKDLEKIRRYDQSLVHDLLGSVTGMNTWAPSKMSRDMAFEPDVQKAILVTSYSPRTLFTARREYRQEPTVGFDQLKSAGKSTHVIACESNASTQRALSEALNAESFIQIPDSSHRSMLAKIDSAELVAAAISERL